MSRYDIEVEGSHNYLADGIIVHNSPETTSGGKALKFYASIRLDVRRIETLKDGTDAVGNRTRVKVVKNKMSPPFKSRRIRHSLRYRDQPGRQPYRPRRGAGDRAQVGAWYTYEGDQLGQGKENARNFLRDNPDLANEIEKRIKEKLGVGPRVDAERQRRQQRQRQQRQRRRQRQRIRVQDRSPVRTVTVPGVTV